MDNKSQKLVFGKGIKGDGVSKVNGKFTKPYQTWRNMLGRCYNPICQKRQPSYVGCSVSDDWLYFPAFEEWFYTNYVEGYQLDKDLLVDGNKEYGSDTCIFVPSQINSLFTDCGRARGDYPVGVSFYKRNSKFEAHVTINGKQQFLGYFSDVDGAHKAYIEAKKANVLRMAEVWKDKIQPKLYEALVRKAHSHLEYSKIN